MLCKIKNGTGNDRLGIQNAGWGQDRNRFDSANRLPALTSDACTVLYIYIYTHRRYQSVSSMVPGDCGGMGGGGRVMQFLAKSRIFYVNVPGE